MVLCIGGIEKATEEEKWCELSEVKKCIYIIVTIE